MANEIKETIDFLKKQLDKMYIFFAQIETDYWVNNLAIEDIAAKYDLTEEQTVKTIEDIYERRKKGFSYIKFVKNFK